MSSYKGEDLFGSGPHRFRSGWFGETVVPNMAIGRIDSGSTPIGPAESDIFVEGRLVGTTWAQLKSRLDAITGSLDSPPTPGTLIDGRGVVHQNMSLIRFEPVGRVDAGRVYSQAFFAVFRRFGV
ncbi:MAG: hypothetical protein ACK54H_04765 [Phycisphaerales bacterium]|jgi:hypothetical protein